MRLNLCIMTWKDLQNILSSGGKNVYKSIEEYLEGYIPHYQMPLKASKGVRLGRDKDLQHHRVIIEFILFPRYLCTSSKYTLGFVRFGLSSTLACNIWQMWTGRPGAPCGDPRSLKGMLWWRDVEWSFWWRPCVCVLVYVSEFHFPYISLISPKPSHFLCFKKIVWWQDYIKPTGFWGTLLANLSSSL